MFFKKKTCPGCKNQYRKAGGRVRFEEDGERHEIEICEDCASLLEKIDKNDKRED